jgi:hypothetical protein
MSLGAEQSGLDHFQPLLSIDMNMDVFKDNWAYCDRLSSYVARMISHNRTDSLLFANLFSSAFNELLETAFRTHTGSGRFACIVERANEVDRVRLSMPADEDVKAFYVSTLSRLTQQDAAEQYRNALFSEGPIDPSIGLFELAIDYDAQLSLDLDEGVLHITADLSLDKAKI